MRCSICDAVIVGNGLCLCGNADVLRERVITLRQQAEAMRAAVECADAYELRDDWRDVLARHGWNENECVAAVFIRKLRRIALATPATPGDAT